MPSSHNSRFDISGIPTCAEMPYGRYVEARNVDELVDMVIQTKKKVVVVKKVNKVRKKKSRMINQKKRLNNSH